jgi:hypothetical protein
VSSVSRVAQDLRLFRNEFNFGPHRLGESRSLRRRERNAADPQSIFRDARVAKAVVTMSGQTPGLRHCRLDSAPLVGSWPRSWSQKREWKGARTSQRPSLGKVRAWRLNTSERFDSVQILSPDLYIAQPKIRPFGRITPCSEPSAPTRGLGEMKA